MASIKPSSAGMKEEKRRVLPPDCSATAEQTHHRGVGGHEPRAAPAQIPPMWHRPSPATRPAGQQSLCCGILRQMRVGPHWRGLNSTLDALKTGGKKIPPIVIIRGQQSARDKMAGCQIKTSISPSWAAALRGRRSPCCSRARPGDRSASSCCSQTPTRFTGIAPGGRSSRSGAQSGQSRHAGIGQRVAG